MRIVPFALAMLPALALLSGVGGVDPSGQAQDSAQEPAPALGKAAPGFRLNDHTGQLVSVGGANETWTVLAFYPKAMTPG